MATHELQRSSPLRKQAHGDVVVLRWGVQHGCGIGRLRINSSRHLDNEK